MGMNSLGLLPELTRLPLDEGTAALDPTKMLPKVRAMDGDQFAIEVSLATEETLEALFHWRNVPDELRGQLSEAYNEAFRRIAEQGTSLTDRFNEVVDRGPGSVQGFVSALKGKVAEVKSEEKLEELFPGYDFELASSPNQPGWDLRGTSPDGEDIFVQVKTGTEKYSDDVHEAMQDSPDVTFAVSNEIYTSLAEANPELVGRLIEIDPNSELTESVNDGLTKLAGNFGIDVPDSLADALPYVGEVIIGIKLLREMVKTERILTDVAFGDRSRIHAIKTLALGSKFGINRVSMFAGGGAGTVAGSFVAPGIGSAVGGVAGMGVGLAGGWWLNRRLQPRLEQVASKLVGGDQEDLFYLMNKVEIDQLGQSFATTQVA